MAFSMFAAIDIGAYEVSMKIFEMAKKNGAKEIDHIRCRLELGRDAYAFGKIETGMLDELCQVLLGFVQIMKEYQITDYRACATSAFRELKNPMVIIEQIYRRTGIKIEVLSNAEQHFLGYKSIAAREAGFKKMIQKGTAILDVGGGSLQVSLFDKDALVTTQCLKLGSLRIRERLKDLEKETTHYDQLIEEFIRNELMSFQRLFLKDREIRHLILMGDFLTDTIFQDKLSESILSREEFTRSYRQIACKTSSELTVDMGLDAEYASLVVPTMVICKKFVDIFDAEALWVPGVALLDGIAYDYGEKKKVIKSVHNFENDILVAARNIAKRYSTSKNHIQGTTKLALSIFDSMKKIHGMKARERLLLQIAVQLHDCGKYINMNEVGECSYNIIMATEIIGLSTKERLIIANAVRYNTTEFAYFEEMNQKTGIDRDGYLVAAKLTAILRLANSMDRSHYQKVEGLKAIAKDGTLQLIVDSNRDISLELGLLKDKVEFFEEIFGIHLELKRRKNR